MLLLEKIKDAASGFGQNYNNINVNVVEKPYFIDQHLRGKTRFCRRLGATNSVNTLEPQNELQVLGNISKGSVEIPFTASPSIDWYDPYNTGSELLKPVIQMKESFHIIEKIDKVRNIITINSPTIIPYEEGDKIYLYAYPINLLIKKSNEEFENTVNTKINPKTLKYDLKNIHVYEVRIFNITLNKQMNKVQTKENLKGDRYFVDNVNGVIYFGIDNARDEITITYKYNDILLRIKSNNIVVLSDTLIKSNLESGFYLLDEYKITESYSIENTVDDDFLYDIRIDNIDDFLTKMDVSIITSSWNSVELSQIKAYPAYESDRRYLPTINGSDELGPVAIDIFSGTTVEKRSDKEYLSLRVENGKEIYTIGGKNYFESGYKNFTINNCISIKKLILSDVINGHINIDSNQLRIYPDKNGECIFKVEFPMELKTPVSWETKIFIDNKEKDPVSVSFTCYPNETSYHSIPYDSQGHPVVVESDDSNVIQSFISFFDNMPDANNYPEDYEIIVGDKKYINIINLGNKEWKETLLESGERYIIDTNTLGLYQTDIHKIAEFNVDGNNIFWKIINPLEGEEVYVIKDEKHYKFIINSWTETISGKNVKKLIIATKSDYPLNMTGFVLKNFSQVRTITYQILAEAFGTTWNGTGLIAKPLLKSLSNLKTKYNEKDKYNNGNIYLGRIQ